jgi:hypothetical protein
MKILVIHIHMYYNMDMDKTTILLPRALRKNAAKLAASLGISLGELIRRKLLEEVANSQTTDQSNSRSKDPIFHNFQDLISNGGVKDAASNHDKYLYED